MYSSSNALNATTDELIHRLRDVIERLTTSDDVLNGRRDVAASDFKQLIFSVAREIDETILPRRLGLFSDGIEVASMIASNRRLIELEIDGRKTKADLEGESAPEAVASAYAHALQALSARSGPLFIRVTGRAPEASTSGATCSARRLAEFGDKSYVKNRLEGFLKTIHAASQGWIFRTGDGEPIGHDPDQEIFEALTMLEDKIRSEAALQAGIRDLGRPGPLCAAFAISKEIQAMVASDGGDLLIAALPSRHMTSTIAQWTAMYGRGKLNTTR